MPVRLNASGLAKAVLRSFMQTSGLEPRLLGANNFRIVAAGKGFVRFELDIKEQHINRMQKLHGGTIASMVDLGGSLAVATMGFFKTGVSTDLHVSFMDSGGEVGQTLTGNAFCAKLGKTLAFTTIEFSNDKGHRVARGSHTKFIAGCISSVNGLKWYQVPDDIAKDSPEEDLDLVRGRGVEGKESETADK